MTHLFLVIVTHFAPFHPLQDVTGIEDLERCRDILDNHNWNLESAVTAETSREETRGNSGNNNNDNNDHLQGRPVAGQPGRPQGDRQLGDRSLLSVLVNLIAWPFNVILSTLIRIIRLPLTLFGTSEPADPLAELQKFKDDFEATFGVVHPPFFRGTYAQALEEAKRELKFLLVYLHSPHHQDTQHFCQSVLTNPDLLVFVQQKDLLFWACSISTREGYRVSQALRENTYPFLALIVLKDNRMTVVSKIEGTVTLATLVNRISQAITDHEASLVVVRAERQARSMNQMIRQQQDLDYQESLEKDRRKEQVRQEEKRKREEEERSAREEQLRQRKRRDDLLKLKQTIHVEPEPDDDEPDCIRLQVVFPDGTRLSRKFKKSQSIRHLFTYVYSHPSAPLQFQITTNFPRRSLPCPCPSLEDENCTANGEPPSFQEVGIFPRDTLFVNDLEA